MTAYSLTHLADRTLLRELADTVSQDRATTARMLAQIAEVDERRLFLPAGYSSMFTYCLHELHMSEDVAYKRIRAARAARQFPVIYPALAEGRLHLAAVVLLTPHLTAETADELLAAAEHRTKAEVELLLAQRFPQPDVPTVLQPIAPVAITAQLAARPVEARTTQLAPGPVATALQPESPGQVARLAPPVPPRAKTAPLSPGRYALQVTVDHETYEQLRHAQALLGHSVPSGDVAEVLKRALGLLVHDLERRKLAKSERPRLEFDHIEAFARGGQATVSGIRLRCRAHNQFAAECTFGPEFMRGKRERSRDRAAHAPALPTSTA